MTKNIAIDAAYEALDGRLGCGDDDEGKAEKVLSACEAYVQCEDALPDEFDAEDYSLPKAVVALVKQRDGERDEREAEAARWQERIEKTITSHGLTPCDASGCDSGDPLDWTDTQVSRALFDARTKGIVEFARAVLHGSEQHRQWLLKASEEFAEDGQVTMLPPAEPGEERHTFATWRKRAIAAEAKLAELGSAEPETSERAP